MWSLGTACWSDVLGGMKTDFEFFVTQHFLHNIYGIYVIVHSQPTHGCHYQDTNFKTPTTMCNLWSGVKIIHILEKDSKLPHFILSVNTVNEPRHEKIGFLHMRKQRHS